jgi:hypothetical protein
MSGIVTMRVGLIGKSCEKKIKTMQVETDGPGIVEQFRQYHKQWNEARFRLSDWQEIHQLVIPT